MKKLITLKLFKKSRLEKKYEHVIAICQNDSYLFKIDGVKTLINKKQFVRETAEYQFKLNIQNKAATYLLTEQKSLFDIDVEQLRYKTCKNQIILEYKLSSENEKIKVEINIEGEQNE